MASFTVKTARLRDALSPLNQIIPKKTHRDVLKCVRISATSGEVHSLQLMVTDLDVFAVNVIEDEEDIIVNDSGEFVVPAQALFDYLKALDEETITLSHIEDDDLVKVFADATEFEVGTQELDEYPDFPEFPSMKDKENWIELPLDELSLALERVLFSVADKGHPRFGALNAVCVETTKDRLCLMSTDQVRASVTYFSVPMSQDRQVLLDPKGLAIIPKLFEGNPYLHLAEDAAVFSSGNIKLFIRYVHGKFPPVATFIDKADSYPNKLCLTPQELLKEVRKAALAADQNKTLKVFLEKNKLCLSTKTRQQRRFAKINIAVPYDGPEMKFSIDCTFLIDLLKAASTEEDIEMCFNRGTDPIHFKQNKYDHIVVPLGR